MSPENDALFMGDDLKKAIEEFIDVYVANYKEYLGKMDIDERHLPSVYKGFPYSIEAFFHPNHSVSVLLKKSNRSRILIVEGEFEEVRSKISEKSFDFMQIFPPYTQWTEDEANRISILDADRDLASAKRLELLGGIESHMDDVKKESDNILQLNPWLDEQSKAQAEKIEKARILIQELYREIETDDHERFARYERELMEIQAFEKVEIEAIASEMEVEVETAIGEVEEQFSEIEEQFNGMEGQMSALEKEFNDLRDGLNDSFEGLRKKLQATILKIDSLESIADDDKGNDDLLDDIKELRDTDRKTNTKVRNSEKEIKELKKNTAITEEIKDTVFRDSKRIHNLNDRTTDLEKEVEKLSTSKSKKLEQEIKALVKRFDKVDKDMNQKIAKAVVFELEAQKPVVIEETSTEPGPKGSTVKKTTKKTTTKKTKKS